ncbi:MAG: RNA polymerase sigma factor FliA [Deltaproteobacteria bacterium]|nr:RNA polymerase sigma factor FliA [Deltaproteobacteria bacterium]
MNITVAKKSQGLVVNNAAAAKLSPAKLSPAILRRNDYATKHHALVGKVARRLLRKLPSHVDLDDLVAMGMLGLLEAADRFDPSRGEKFEAFAEFRIRGAMLDGLRSRDSLSRDMRRVSTELKRASAALVNQLGREPSEVEVAAHLGVSIEQVQARRAKLSGWSVVGFDDAGPAFLEQTADENVADPCEAAQRREFFGQMVDHIEKLPEKMQQVLALYYCEDLNLKEIGHVLGVTESRVCQLHGEATKRLRVSLGESFMDQAAA